MSKVWFFGNPLNFLKSYSSNRTQKTNYKDTLSDIKVSECGVPKGSILRPLLFIIYINDFSNNIKTESTILVDDTTLLCSGNDKEDLKSNLITNI